MVSTGANTPGTMVPTLGRSELPKADMFQSAFILDSLSKIHSPEALETIEKYRHGANPQ